MNTIQQMVKEAVMDKTKAMGFKCNRYFFRRRINDVIQHFNIDAHNWHYKIEFSVSPLCEPRYDTSGDENIFNFVDRNIEFLDLVPVEFTAEYDMEEETAGATSRREGRKIEIASELSGLTEKYLFPFFIKADSAEKALKCEIALFNKCFDISPEETEVMFLKNRPHKYFYYNLQFGNYDEAAKGLETKIEELKYYNECRGKTEPNPYIEGLEYTLRKVRCRDMEYIKNFIEENKNITLRNPELR